MLHLEGGITDERHVAGEHADGLGASVGCAGRLGRHLPLPHHRPPLLVAPGTLVYLPLVINEVLQMFATNMVTVTMMVVTLKYSLSQ